MTKKDKEDFKNFTKCWICGNNHVHTDMKVSDHCHITGKYRGSAHWNISLKSNHKIPVLFHNLKVSGLSKVITNIKMYCWIKNVWDTQWLEFIVVWMTKHISKALNMMD